MRTVKQLVDVLIDCGIRGDPGGPAHNARPSTSAPMVFLVGAGFSLSAGVPGTAHLVRALTERASGRARSWGEIFDATVDAPDPACGASTSDYFSLIAKVCAVPAARQAFITEAVRWAARRRVQMSVESILLAAILVASCGGEIPPIAGQDPAFSLRRGFARHVFTTNFDEVLPSTMYYGNEPADIVDLPTYQRDLSHVEHPAIVYLHGRHLHYDIRNTPAEIRGDGVMSGEDDVVSQFRRLLKTHGLIVIGYSGADDRVLAAVAQALADPNSLPFGMWWSAYPDVTAVSEAVRHLVLTHERAHFLTPGEDAQSVMTSLAEAIGVDATRAIARWQREAERVAGHIGRFLEQSAAALVQYVADLRTSIDAGDKDSVRRLVAGWPSRRRVAEASGDLTLMADALTTGAAAFRAIEKPSRAEALLRSAVTTLLKLGDRTRAADAMRDLAVTLLWLGKQDDARDWVERAVSIHTEDGSRFSLAEDLGVLSDLLVGTSLAQALRAAEESHALHLELKATGPAATALRRTADILLGLNRVAEAEQAARESLRLYESVDSSLGAGNALGSLADILRRQFRLAEAEDAASEAVQHHRASADLVGLGVSLKRLAELQYQRGALADAQGNGREALACHQEAEDRLGQANDLQLLGLVLAEAGELASAGECASRAQEIHRALRDSSGYAADLCVQGDIHMRRGNYTAAESAARRASATYRRAGNQAGEAEALLLEAQTLWTDRPGLARRRLSRAGRISRRLGDKRGRLRALILRARLEAGEADYRAARRILHAVLRCVETPLYDALAQESRELLAKLEREDS